jgi:predicted lipoprotein with Yx(FWY)xxD motif
VYSLRVSLFNKENHVKANPSIGASIAGALAAAALLAGCGGSYGASSTMYNPNPSPSQSPAQQTVPLTTTVLKGTAGFVNVHGFTLYVFDADLAAPGTSTCNDACAQNWPPLATPAGALPAPYGSIARADGSHQLTYNGRPLYAFLADGQPGQTNGDGLNAFGGIWHIARP